MAYWIFSGSRCCTLNFKNGSEFGRAGVAGKLFRTALTGLLLNSADGRMVSRFTQQMLKVIQLDTVSKQNKESLSKMYKFVIIKTTQ